MLVVDWVSYLLGVRVVDIIVRCEANMEWGWDFFLLNGKFFLPRFLAGIQDFYPGWSWLDKVLRGNR